MSEGGAQDPLRELGKRLDEAQRALDRKQPRDAVEGGATGGKALALAWRIGLELVVAIVIATAIGWGLDRWLGTKPWLTILLFFLGVGAGMVNVWRAVTGLGMAVGYRRQPGKDEAAPKAKDWDEDED